MPAEPDSRTALGRCLPDRGEVLLLQAALVDDHEAAVAAWKTWAGDHDVRTVHWRSHSLLPLVAARLPADLMGPEAAELARLLRRRAWTQNQLILSALADTLAVLDPVAPAPLVVKGAALITDVYAPGLRSMGDADVVVGVADFPAALAALRRAGWEPTERLADADFSRAVPLRTPSGRSIDLHRWVAFPRYTRAPEDGLWARALPTVHGATPARHLYPADQLVVAILHGLDPREPSAVRWPADVAMIARHAAQPPNETPSDATSTALWDQVVSTATELGVGRRVAEALTWCRDDLDLDVPDAALVQMQAQPPDRWLDVEWRAKRRGLPVFARVRHYRDGTREVGGRPTPWGYAEMRRGLLREGGGLRSFATTRIRRGRATFDQYRRSR